MRGEYEYYSAVSGLTPVEKFTLDDHRTAFWAAQTGLPSSVGQGELKRAFYSASGGEYQYFLTATGLASTIGLAAAKLAFFLNPSVATSVSRIFRAELTTV